jgi:hypothetical protein
MQPEMTTKICAACGRQFSWRRKWSRCWDQVRYCSQRCRRRQLRAVDEQLERAIRQLLSQRRRDGTICPSEAARQVEPGAWRTLMEPARAAGRRLAAQGQIVVLQRGRRVDPTDAKGPIRYGRGDAFPDA